METARCPVCGAPGERVPTETVRSLARGDVDSTGEYFVPKYACYCNRVTEAEVSSAVRDGGARTVADVARLTGAMRGGACLTNNPRGVCCHGRIIDLVERAMR